LAVLEFFHPSTAAPERAPTIQRRIGGHAVDESGEARLGAKAVTISVEAQEGFLGEIFSVLLAPHHPIEEAVDAALVSDDQLCEGGIVAFTPARDKILIGIVDNDARPVSFP